MIFGPLEKKYLPYISEVEKKIGAGSQISLNQLAFLVSILDKVKPKKVLEVGVANGGTTCILLDMLNKQGKDALLYSVDLNKNYYCDEKYLTGYKVKEHFPELMKNWELLTGDVLPTRMDTIGGGIDLVILDTAHTLPGELLDFPVVLPFLQDEAWVILHDTNLFIRKFLREAIAPKVLFDTVVAEKHLYYEDENGQKGISNIAAFRVNSDSRKYISSCFLAMSMPWTYSLSNQEYKAYKECYQKHYSEELVEFFELAYRQNCQWIKDSKEEDLRFRKKIGKQYIRDFRRKIFFYSFFKSLFGKN